ncbi:hypothetical protein [uncultured Bacteroides sp.]|uniref:hypothetical protein n=1 Tax=uncultured Bacteroides sp. TaxID=162156 RepID=UPI0025D0F32E|nr:hypothetical protein [uncultured Bacteroides sp.]
MTKLIEQNICSSCTNVNKPHCFDKNNRRYLAFSALVLFSTTCIFMKGQTVNYKYDASGNVISKVVVLPPKVVSFNIENDSIPLLNNFLAYTPIKIKEKSTHTSSAQVQVPYKISDDVNAKSSKEKPLVTSK